MAVITWDGRSPASALLPPLASLFSKCSHQLGNELAYLLGTIELAAASESGDPSHLEELRRGLLGLCERARSASWALREAAPDQWAWCPAHQVLGKARRLAEEAAAADAPAPSPKIACRAAPSLETYVHEPLVANAVAGVVLNAWEAGAGRITLEASQAGGGIVLAVSDTGPGIAGDLLTRVADPFESTKPPPHWGLGLTLALAAALQHGGSLTVASEGAGRGTRVELLLRVPVRPARHAHGGASGL